MGGNTGPLPKYMGRLQKSLRGNRIGKEVEKRAGMVSHHSCS